MPGPQVLIGQMSALLDDLLRGALADVDVEVLPRGSSIAALRPVGEDDPPPVVLVASNTTDADPFERDLLRPHPEALILRVECDGQVLATRVVEVRRHDGDRLLTSETLIDAIRTAPSWRARFV